MNRSKVVLFVTIFAVGCLVGGYGGYKYLDRWDYQRTIREARKYYNLVGDPVEEMKRIVKKTEEISEQFAFVTAGLATTETPKTVEYTVECMDDGLPSSSTTILVLNFNTEVPGSALPQEGSGSPLRKDLEKVHGVTHVSLYRYRTWIARGKSFFNCESLEKSVLPILEKHFGAKLKRVELPTKPAPQKPAAPGKVVPSASQSSLRVEYNENFPERIIIRTNWRLAGDTDLILTGPLSQSLKRVRGVDSAMVFPHVIFVQRKSNRDRWGRIVPGLMTALSRQYGDFTKEPAFREPRAALPSADELRRAILCAQRN